MAELRVLVCDDDHDMLELMLRRLDKMGFKPDRAGDGGVAQNLIQENLYDLIVTDIYMPEATGLELLELAKQRDPQVQVVIVTASATLDNAIDALNHGAFGYLTKPFDHLSVFDTTISRALEFRQLIMANRRMAEAQKMRGDMLEDEVAKRVGQLREKQQGLLDLLNCLPDGIVVVEEGGKLMMTSPAAEQWLARDRRSQEQPISEFLGQVHTEWAESTGYAQLGEDSLRLLSIDYPHPNGKKRKAVIIRRSEQDEAPSGPGTLALESVAAIKEGLAWLFRQKLSDPMKQRIRELANHINTLEQVTAAAGQADGMSSGTRTPDLAPAVLPEYLRHKPALDSGAAWEQSDGAPSGENGKLAHESERPARSEPDTRPAASRSKTEHPAKIEVQPETLASKPVAQAEQKARDEEAIPISAPQPKGDAQAEAQPDPDEPPGELEFSEQIRSEEPPEPEELPTEAQEHPAGFDVSLATEPPEMLQDGQEVAPRESIGLPADLTTAPANVPTFQETELGTEPQPEAASDPEPPEESAADSGLTSTGRVPLWQRFSKKRGATPAKDSLPEPELRGEPVSEPDQAVDAEPEWPAEPAPEPAFEHSEEQPLDVAARLGLAGVAEPAPKSKQPQEAAEPPWEEPTPEPPKAEAAPKPSRAQVEPSPRRAQRALAREPEPAAAGANRGVPAGKKKRWPPKLPSQDPEFDPELDVSG